MRLRNILWIILILIIVLFVVRLMARTGAKKTVEERIIPVVVSNPRIGQIQEKVTLVGDVRAETEVAVRPKSGGRVEEIYVNEGDEVKTGDKMLSFVAGIKPDNELYRDMVTFAPISGIVGVKNVKQGQQITSSLGTPDTVFTVYKIDNVKIYVSVSEKYYSMVRPGTLATVQLDAFPGRAFSGSVNNVRPIIDPLTRTTQVEIIIPNADHKIKPGMFSKVELVLSQKNNVMILPADSILGLDGKYVFVMVEGFAVKKAVTVGAQQENDIEITSGLTSSDRVITVGQRVVQEGSKVDIAKND